MMRDLRIFDRRELIAGASSLAGTSAIGGVAAAQSASSHVRLRLLATSDLHAFVAPWDYYKDRADPTVGLVSVASLIRAARGESPNVLLLDNGDLLQGSPLADHIAEAMSAGRSASHPIIDVMSDIGYDAACLGNHDFNYGLEFLERCVAGARFPFVCANVARLGGAPFIEPYVVLERRVLDDTGGDRLLRIGVTGFVPPQIMRWDKSRLEGKVVAEDILASANRIVPELRTKCDVLIALSHSGISAAQPGGSENVSLQLASVPGIDAVITGHSHRLFPGRDYQGVVGADAANGRLGNVPAVMPGFWGSHLGQIDLEMSHSRGAWSVERSTSTLRPIYSRRGGEVSSLAPADERVLETIAPAHAATRAWVRKPVGRIDAGVHSYFVWAGHDPATGLVNAAQRWYSRQALAGGPYADLPILSAAAPFRAGYTPEAFIDIAAGEVRLADAADLYMYSNNTVVAVRVTGAQVLDWLEHAARAFNTLIPGNPAPQPLIARGFPSYNFDIIDGITYAIALDREPKYNLRGEATGAAGRITDLKFGNEVLAPDREFIVVTNSHRADSASVFPPLASAPVVLRAPDSNRDALIAYFRSAPVIAVNPSTPWRFERLSSPTRVYFDTGRTGRNHLSDVKGLRYHADTLDGFIRVNFDIA